MICCGLAFFESAFIRSREEEVTSYGLNVIFHGLLYNFDNLGEDGNRSYVFEGGGSFAILKN